jgi:hypothetical protein
VAVVAAIVGFILADAYIPHSPGAVVAQLSAPVRRSDRWTDWHRATSWVLVLAAVISLALVVAIVARGWSIASRNVTVIGAAIVAVVMSVVTVITRPLVEWDQLALSSVTVGSDIDGYWNAAFGDDVLFVLIGGSEVSQGEYGAALVTHLAAPVIAASALLVVGAAVGRRRVGARQARTVEPAA